MKTTFERGLAVVFALAVAFVLSCSVRAPRSTTSEPEPIVFSTTDGASIHADAYGHGSHAVVLAHGGRFDKASWGPQARALADGGFRVLALDFRGYGGSQGPGDTDPLRAPLHLDVLAAVAHARAAGAETVSVVGGSMGGTAAAVAAITAGPGAIDRLVLLAPGSLEHPEQLAGRKLVAVAREDPTASGAPRLARIREQFESLPEPKELLVFDGAAHAQFLFQTDQGARLMGELVRFLSTP